MSLGFRRSVRLFPGVRLNFSGSGISTTVGVRGASMTFGPRGTYLNAGLPGTGLSYRTRITPAPSPRTPTVLAGSPSSFAAYAPEPDLVEIRSAEVSALTSPGLGELKRLINEATTRRRQLSAAVADDRQALSNVTTKLRLARSFIIRIFTQKMIPRLVRAVEDARLTLEARTTELEGCVIEVDFAFDDASYGSYAALVRAFEALSASQRIWDVTTVQATNRFRERTVATTSVSRTLVRFDFVVPEIVRSPQQALRMGNVSGRDIYFYPGFLMMRDGGGDFALIEYKELDADFSATRFIEEEIVPSDTEVVGHTWKKANKDGSPDRRFNDNYKIPIVRYGEVVFRSATGLFEAYQFSDFEKSSVFDQALSNHRRTLASLARKTDLESIAQLPFGGETYPGPEDGEEIAPAQGLKTDHPPNLIFDWTTLVVAIVMLVVATNWLAHHPSRATAPRPVPVVAQTVTPAKPAAKASQKHRKKARHSAAAASKSLKSDETSSAI